VNRTRFAPAPTGYLHLGHVANAIVVWGLAAAEGADVLFRIEDHDRIRSRPEYDAALVEDLAWLGFVPDEGPIRQREDRAPYEAAVERLRADGRIYACACSRATFDAWEREQGDAWSGPGCPGGCRDLEVDGPTLRVALGGGTERWMDLLVGPCADDVAPAGDPPVRDRDGNWTYLLCVVVDDVRQDIDLVVRGRDLLASTPAQIRLARLLGREAPPAFAHHRLVRDSEGRKLSKSSGDTGVRELRAAGHSADEVVAMAAAAIGYEGDPNIGRRRVERRAIGETHTR
jgi:glutamyl/glutaminyl-tRNA synthetase